MGFLDKLLKPKPKAKTAKAPRQESTPEALRGPDPGTLLTPAEIESATGSVPIGEGDRRSGGIDVDTGFLRVCIWQLADGGELLVNACRLRDEAGVALWRSRWDDPSWQDGPKEKPLEGIGELARWKVKKVPKGGGTELHVTAKQGWFQSQLVHTSPEGRTEIEPLARLMATVLARLQAS